jgi:hypothetical protein
MHALLVVPHEQITFKILIRRSWAKAFEMRLTAWGKFSLIGGDTAIRAGQKQHS